MEGASMAWPCSSCGLDMVGGPLISVTVGNPHDVSMCVPMQDHYCSEDCYERREEYIAKREQAEAISMLVETRNARIAEEMRKQAHERAPWIKVVPTPMPPLRSRLETFLLYGIPIGLLATLFAYCIYRGVTIG